MEWVGTWRNEHGSVIAIDRVEGGVIHGRFTTALASSALHGQTVPLTGLARGPLLSVVAGGSGGAGDVLVAYTGRIVDGRLKTLWHMIGDHVLTAGAEGAPAERVPLEWWRAITTSADTFERID